MVFDKYYRELARKGGRNTPRADEAKRDYLKAMQASMDGLLAAR